MKLEIRNFFKVLSVYFLVFFNLCHVLFFCFVLFFLVIDYWWK